MVAESSSYKGRRDVEVEMVREEGLGGGGEVRPCAARRAGTGGRPPAAPLAWPYDIPSPFQSR